MGHSNRLIILLCFILFWVSGCASGPGIHKIPEYTRGSVTAVWDLEDMSSSSTSTLQDMQEFLTAKVSEILKEKGGYTIIERVKLLLALEELHLGSSSLANETSRLAVGKIVGAQLMVFGAYQQVGTQFRIDLRMIEVQSGAVVRTAEKTIQATDVAGWLEAVEEAAGGIL
jgi:hypothetical protein